MQFNKKIFVNGREISDNSPVYIIAEAGVNHLGDMRIAKKMVDVALAARADAIKFQSFKTENLILKNIEKAPYQKETTNPAESQYEMLKKLEVSKKFTEELMKYCKLQGITFLSTPFDEASLRALHLPAYKISSTDITNLLFLRKVAKKRRPIILSTGMSNMCEIELALEEIIPFNKDVIILHCTSNYPIQDSEVNLSALNTLKNKFDILVGFPDHSLGIGAGAYAVPMGAKVIEKHFTLNKDFDGPDHTASLSPEELIKFVEEIRKVETYLGQPIKMPTFSELNTKKSLQKYFVARINIQSNEIFTESNIIAKRTGGEGLSPIYYKNVLGKRAKKSFKKDEIIVV